ncbi:hypothetical protein HYU91_01560 [Candidatus Collierbacteria bacterium]|nr:hypothetical protein [Candidatus Collierbacteria bacterium]
MLNLPEIATPKLNRETNEFSSCLFSVELPIHIGPLQAVGSFHVNQFFGTDSIIRNPRPSSRTSHQALEIIAKPSLVFNDSDYLFASNALFHAQYGPLTGYSEALFFPIDPNAIHSIENLFATSAVLADIDGWFQSRLNKLKGARPKTTPTHHFLLNGVCRYGSADPIRSILGTVRPSDSRVLSLELDYKSSSFSVLHHHLTGCLPTQTALDLIQTEEAKSPELRLARFLAELWTVSGGNLGYHLETA